MIGVGLASLLSAVSLLSAAPTNAARASTAPTNAASTEPDARTAPIRTVRVPWGKIGYRSVGHGPALVLLVGGGGNAAPSIDDWPPLLVDRLAETHRVLAMDYEGVGRTTLRPGSLSIDRLADDTRDFMRALHLRRADVLGWSMGGMVAQALAVRHPHLIRRLVLCSTALGNGTARQASVSGQPKYPAQWLFPLGPKNRARAAGYERQVHAYRHYYEGPQKVAGAQGIAIYLWLTGHVHDGHDAGQIDVPTLVGGGRHDVLLPLPDTRDVARKIHRAKLKLYSDAAHGFLVQHQIAWSRRVERFLG